jgi:hypothetical protein
MRFPPSIKVFGSKEFRDSKCPSETSEQVTFFNVLRQLRPELGAIAVHPRNEGKRSWGQVARQKAEGMTKGASDIIIPGSPAFVCELKRKDHTKSRLEIEQTDYLLACQNMGAFACIALGWEGAMEAVNDWSKKGEESAITPEMVLK